MRFQIRVIISLILLLWCAGIFIEWFLPYENNLLFGLPFLQKSYSLVCHQQKAKLILFDHGETLVCARCTGIYLGFLFSSVIVLFKMPKEKPRLKFLYLAAVPMIIDVILYSFGFYRYSKPAAFITGLLLGSVGFLYLYAGLNNLIRELKN